jgi:uncharacterized cupredoxin-like copper-binding protein
VYDIDDWSEEVRMKYWLPIFAVAAFSLAGAVYAHGDESHPKKTAGSAKVEQKPFGTAGDARVVARTVRFAMSDAMRFEPSTIAVKQGETVRFIIKNDGKLMHEMVLGTMQDLKEHADLMKQFPDMEHEEPYMAHVAPGKAEEIVWRFNRAGEFHFACLIAGHFEAGMMGKVSVQ